MADLEPVDYDPFAPQLIGISHDPFATAPQRFVDGERLSRVPPAARAPDMYAERFKHLPASTNVEDRRNEIGINGLVQAWTGLAPDEWAVALKHPMTPFLELFPQLPNGQSENSQMAIDAGIKEIGVDGRQR